jgi:uncharacterized protein YbjT (DUF2867 family)
MTTLVIGGTGKVGSVAVRALSNEGVAVRVLTRSPESARVPAGVEVMGGNLEDPESLTRAFVGIERAGLILPLHPEEEKLGLHAVRAAADAGVERVVFLSIHQLERLPDAGHVTAKRAVEREMERLRLPAVVLRPNSFFQNDLAVKPVIVHQGVYPVPLGPVGCHAVDTRDVGESLAALLRQDGGIGQRVPAVGPEALTGEGAAEIWGEALGREVRYGGADLEAWAAQAGAHLPAWMVENLVIMYRHFAEHGLLASAAEIAACERLLGHPPRRYADFVAETARFPS